MTVMKFGGSSLATAELLDHAIGIAEGALADGAVLVASAMGGSTDRLQRVAHLAGEGTAADAGREVERLQREHGNAAGELLEGTALAGALARLDALFDELRVIVGGMSALRQWTPRSNDAVLGFGERAASSTVAARSPKPSTASTCGWSTAAR